jgi:hypothetical protein
MPDSRLNKPLEISFLLDWIFGSGITPARSFPGTTQYDRLNGTFNISVIKMHSFPHYSYIIPYVFDRSGQSSDKEFDNFILNFQMPKIREMISNFGKGLFLGGHRGKGTKK